MAESTNMNLGLLEGSNNPSSADEAEVANGIMDTIKGGATPLEEMSNSDATGDTGKACEQKIDADKTCAPEPASTAEVDTGVAAATETDGIAASGDMGTMHTADTGPAIKPMSTQTIQQDRKTTTDRVYACAVRPKGLILTEAMVAEAWKESTNAYSKRREIHLIAQAVDPKTKENVGKSVDFSVIPNDLSHGGVPGRTVCFTGCLANNVNIPNYENGGLHPKDEIGWSEGCVWIAIVFDLYDQVGEVLHYVNKDGLPCELPATNRSTALNPNAIPPIML